jgi:prophage regulatory protein
MGIEPNKLQNSGEVIRLHELEKLTGRKRSSVYEDMAAGRLPKQIKIGPRAVGWLRSDIDEWLSERVAERDQEVAA